MMAPSGAPRGALASITRDVSQRGYTLIELMILVAIISIISAGVIACIWLIVTHLIGQLFG